MSAPPRILERILEHCVAHLDGRRSMQGDLRGEFVEYEARLGRVRAVVWYASQVVSIGAPFIAQRIYRATIAGLRADGRDALRGILRSPGYAGVALFSLVVGIGVNTAAFSVVNAVLYRPLPYPDASRLIDVGEFHPEEICEGCGLSASSLAYDAWREGLDSVERFGATTADAAVMDTGAERRRLRAASVDHGLFALLGARALVGRLFDAGDLRADGQPTAVLGFGLWNSVFGSDSSVVGRSIEVAGVERLVIGILPRDFRFVGRADLFVPLRRESVGEARELWVIGRLETGTDIARVQRELDLVSARLANAHPEHFAGWRAIARPLRTTVLNEIGDPRAAALILIATATVLLVACANLASVTGARSLDRSREMVIRGALGASRVRMLRFAMGESVVLAALGGMAAILTAYALASVLETRLGPLLPPWIVFGVDGRLVGFAALVTVGAALIAGGLPAYRASRIEPRAAMGGSGRGVEEIGAKRFRGVLVAIQIGLSTILMATAAYSLREYGRVTDRDNLGYDPNGVTAVSLDLTGAGNPRSVVGRIAARLRQAPGTESVAIEQDRFVGTFGSASAPSLVRVEGRAEPIGNDVVPRHSAAVSTGYFQLLRIPIRRGRAFTEEDARRRSGVAVVNVLAAEVLWPGLDPLGRQLWIEDSLDAGPLTVIGVAGNVVVSPLQASRRGHARIYTLHDESPGRTTDILVRGAPLERAAVLAAIHEVEPRVIVPEVMTLNAHISRWVRGSAIIAGVMTGIAAMALILAAIGIYGGLSYSVSHRLREIGIRRALGADRGSIQRLVAGTVLPVCLVGVTIGIVASRGLATLRGAMGIHVGAADPVVLTGVSLVVVGVGVVATIRPLRRALRVTPSEFLRDA